MRYQWPPELTQPDTPEALAERFFAAVDMAVEDLYDATSFIVGQARAWGLDPSAVVASGSSAGAITVLQGEYERCTGSALSRRLPEGYNTMLTGNGANLSQGQRQLLAIARAAVADPPVMILDEATSSIDTRTEAIVQRGMDQLMEGRTVFVIAHRLSTVKNSDVIMVLDHGRIIERGSHEKLIAERGTYYQLYTGAFELE